MNAIFHGKRIIRVFAARTSCTPDEGDYVYYGAPLPMIPLPEHDEVHISCTFTWDKEHAKWLAEEWRYRTRKPVKLGGPAFLSIAENFTQGLYLKPNIIFTTRGCNNSCPWCVVPAIEGRLRELSICAGNIIQDNNFMQANRAHKDKVFQMLRTQRKICFKGGLQCDLIDDHFVSAVTSLRIAELWLACDSDDALPGFKRACEKLVRAGFDREIIRCYALIGDDIEKNEARLREIYCAGAMPFAQLYRDYSNEKTRYDKEWNGFARMWQRPAATRAHMERGTSMWDYKRTVPQLSFEII
jgi:hypothetical protein